ncbi:MAG: polysaccharide deacetylase family protein [Dongiaceae bacterium]
MGTARRAGDGSRRPAMPAWLGRLGVVGAVHRLWARRLTVLAYHRICEPGDQDGVTLASNISATPERFAAQMAHLRRRFDVIALGDLIAWLEGRGRLPRHPALITFDDGYRDNLTEALPILRAAGLPAVLFLATDCVELGQAFYWDQVAWALGHATGLGAVLPLLGACRWHDAAGRAALAERWVRAAKALPDAERQAMLGRLLEALAVRLPAAAHAGLHLTWDEVRTLQRGGVEIGAHTRRHAILSRRPAAEAEAEIAASAALIAERTGRPVTAFAYPNGGIGDFDESHEAVLRRLGIPAGFTLVEGPQSLAAVRRRPLRIRRIFIGRRDDLPRFAAKVSGTARLAAALRPARGRPAQGRPG